MELLLREMTLEEKAGLFFHTMISLGPDGELTEPNPAFDLPSADDYVERAAHDALQPASARRRRAGDGRLAQRGCRSSPQPPVSASR